MATYSKKISQLPASVREWFGSDEVSNRVDSIYTHFGFNEDQSSTINGLIKRILIRDLEPKYFAGELSLELKLERDRAKTITDEVSRLIFAPVKNDFLSVNIAIDDFSKFEIPIVKLAEPTPIARLEKATTSKPLEIKTLSDIAPAPKPFQNSTPAKPVSQDSTNSAPAPAPVFIIKQTEAKPLNADISIGKPIMGLNILNKVPQAPAPTRATAQVQIGNVPLAPLPQNKTAHTEVPQIKVIHYSQFTSPVKSAAPNSEIAPAAPVSIHALGAITSAPTAPPINSPSAKFETPTPKPLGSFNASRQVNFSNPILSVPKPSAPVPPAPKPPTSVPPTPTTASSSVPSITPIKKNYIETNPGATPIQPRPLPKKN